MNVPVDEFNSYSEDMKRNAMFTIKQIQLNEGVKEFDLILDIGSGSGNMTLLLADNINCKKIIGLDIDDKMIEFAQQNHKRDYIDYVLCDIEAPWDQLSDRVKQIEGKCSLIYSSNVLHWIRNIDNCAENLSKFLKPGGRIYALMLPVDDLYRVSDKTRELELVFPLLKLGNFTRSWKSVLTNNELQIEVADEIVKNVITTKPFAEKFISTVQYSLLLRQTKNEEERKLVEKYKDWLETDFYKTKITIDEEGQFRFDLKSLFIVARK